MPAALPGPSRPTASSPRDWMSRGPAAVVTQDGSTYRPGTLIVRPVGRRPRSPLSVSPASWGCASSARAAGVPASAAGRPCQSRALPALERRHRRRLDALVVRAVRSSRSRRCATPPRGRETSDAAFDVIVLPGIAGAAAHRGQSQAGSLPDEYVGGLGQAGVAALSAFVQAGGTLVCIDSSAQLAIDALQLPVKNARGGPAGGAVLLPGLDCQARGRWFSARLASAC